MYFKSFSRPEQFLCAGASLGFLLLFAVSLAGSRWVLFLISLATLILALSFLRLRFRALADAVPEDVRRQMENEELISKRRIQELEQSLSEAQERLDSLWESAAREKNRADALLEKERERLSFSAILPPVSEVGPVDLIAVAREAVQTLSPYARNSRIRLQLAVSAEGLSLTADKGWLKIMLLNIIDNSIKYMQRPGTLVITLSPVGTDAFIVLKDNGAGLPENEVEHIFEINYQGSNRQSGNGLGLAQSKAIIEYYGGTVYAKSALGRGMAIYIQLPM